MKVLEAISTEIGHWALEKYHYRIAGSGHRQKKSALAETRAL
jgi:hypothetical protein